MYHSTSLSISNNSLSKSFLSTCLVCNSLHKTSASDSQNFLEKKQEAFESCSKYLKVETAEITESLRWDFTKDPLPYCASCFLSAHKVYALHDQIETIKLEIDSIVKELTAAIHKSYELEIKCIAQSNSEEEAKAAVQRCNLVQTKILHYRNTVVKGSLRKAPKLRGTNSGVGSENEIEIKDEPSFDWSEDFDNLSALGLGSYLDEPSSPFQGIRDIHEPTVCNNNAVICSSKKRKQTTVKVESSTSCRKKRKCFENQPESIQRIMESYGMHNKTLVIKLHKIQKDKSGKWSFTEEETRNRPPFNSKNGRRRNTSVTQIKRIKTERIEGGKGICAGVLMIPTPDGKQQCGECNKIYETRTKLSRHIKNFHAGIQQKRYYKPKYTSKYFKFINTPEGQSYAGVKLTEQSDGRVQCGSCERICTSKQAVATHIRWYHLGKDVAQAYRKRREAYHVKRKVVLGANVPETELLKAEEMLKNKEFLIGVMDPTDIEELNSGAITNSSKTCKPKLSSKMNVKKIDKQKQNAKSKTSPNVKAEKNESIPSKVEWKEDASDGESDNDQLLDDSTNDPDFSPDERIKSPDANDPDFEEYAISDSESCVTADESDEEDTNGENSKEIDVTNYELNTQEDGQQFYGGIKIITTSDSKLQCGECGITQIYYDMIEMQQHVRNAHLEKKNESQSNQKPSYEKERPKLTVHEDGKKYFGGVQIKEHYLQNGKQICGKCKKLFTNMSTVVRHIKSKHLGIKANMFYTRRLRAVRTEDGKLNYGGIEVENLENGKCKCGFCNRILDSFLRMRRHVRECHLNETRKESLNIVVKDGKRFFGGIEVISKDDGKEECGCCKLVCADGTAIQSHIKSKHLGMKLKVYHVREKYEDLFFKTIDTEDGNKTYAGVTILMSKEDEENYTCGTCRKSFNQLKAITRHIRYMHPNTDMFAAPVKDKSKKKKVEKTRRNERTYYNPDGLLYCGILCKKLEDGTYQCGFGREGPKLCAKISANCFSIVAHIRNNHIKPKITKRMSGRYVNKTVTTEDGRKIYAGVEMVKLDNGDLQCGECQRVYKPKAISGLMGHIIRVHEQKEGGTFVCNVCGKNCGYKFNLAKHMLNHKDSKTFVCDICGLAYKQESSLTHHVRQVHKGIKRHTCDQCGKQYYHTRDFIIHQRRHTGEKPFQCCTCGRDFYSVYEMKVHEKTHNEDRTSQSKPRTPREKSIASRSSRRRSRKKGNDFECDYCDNSFRTLAAAKKHMLEEHQDSDSDANDCDQVGGISNRKEDCVPNPQFPQSNAPNEQSNEFMMPRLENMGSASVESFNRIPPMAHHLPTPAPPTLFPMYDYTGAPAFSVYGRPPYPSN